MAMIKFVTALQFCSCTPVKDSSIQLIKCLKGAPRASVVSETCFSGPGKYSFEVWMKEKKVKTAVGFLSQGQTTEYMRDTPLSEPHISFGGAGWIHPKEIAASKKYTEGDRVKAEVDFGQSVVRFYVNSECVGEDEWTSSTAYPAISVDGGPCELEVSVS